ncbi:IMPO [Hepatospora eriocheir]|uniref:IMPO n=1 Tax=Hepatospora eriocheir TaxID=1081669 RepID=A0A1X0QKZ1_9MICR|nr:IMPO [Hepatospora eriocheir]
MESQLRELFLHTLSPIEDVRIRAETELNKIQKDPNVLLAILQLCLHDSDPVVKASSSLFIANKVKDFYKDKELEQFISYLEKHLVNMICSTKDRVVLGSLTKMTIALFDNASTENILIFLDAAGEKLMTNDSNNIEGGLLIYENVFNSDSFKVDRKVMCEIMFNRYDKTLISILENSIRSNNLEIVGKCMMLFRNGYSLFGIPSNLTSISTYTKIMGIALQIINLTGDSKELLFSKKWAFKFLYKTFNKGIRKEFNDDKLNDFMRSEDVINTMLNVFGNCIGNFQSKLNTMKPDEEEIFLTTAKFFEFIFKRTKLKGYVINHAATLLNSFIIPGCAYTDEIESLFELDIKKYLQERYSYSLNDLREGLGDLFLKMIDSNDDVRNNLLPLLVDRLRNSEIDCKTKYGILGLLVISQKQLKSAIGKDQFDIFIMQTIFLLLHSSELFLVSQALYFIAYIEDCVLDSKFSYEQMTFIYNLIEHQNEIIKVEACLATSFFFENQELRPYISEMIPGILSKIIVFNRSYFLDSLNEFMTIIVESFPENIQKFSLQFSEQIIGSLQSILADEDKFILAAEYILLLVNLVDSNDDFKSVNLIFDRCYNLISEIFTNLYVNVFQEALELIDSFIFKLELVNDKMNHLFKLILFTDLEEIILYDNESLSLIDNFVSYAPDHYLDTQVLVRIVDYIKYLTSSAVEYDELDLNLACDILISMLLYKGKYIAETNPLFISHSIDRIIKVLPNIIVDDYKSLILCLEVIMTAFLVAPNLTVTKMSELGQSLDGFLKICVENQIKFCRVIDKKIFILFMVFLFKQSFTVDTRLINVNYAFTEVFTTLPGAIKRRELLERKERSSDQDENLLESDVYGQYIEENLGETTAIDSLNVYEIVAEAINNPVTGSFGEECFKSMSDITKTKIFNTISNEISKKK